MPNRLNFNYFKERLVHFYGTVVKSCDYNSIKILTALKFASVDYKEWSTYEPRDSERGVFRKCKAVADAFDEALYEQIE